MEREQRRMPEPASRMMVLPSEVSSSMHVVSPGTGMEPCTPQKVMRRLVMVAFVRRGPILMSAGSVREKARIQKSELRIQKKSSRRWRRSGRLAQIGIGAAVLAVAVFSPGGDHAGGG